MQLSCVFEKKNAISCLRHERIKLISLCYTIQAFKQAYGFSSIMPLRDKVHWEKMNGAEFKPPLYEKGGRPKKSWRKQPQELEGSTKISKHGVQIHCTYCGGCKRKADLNGKKLPVKRSRESPHGGEEPDITQVEYNIIIQYPIQVIIELTFNC